MRWALHTTHDWCPRVCTLFSDVNLLVLEEWRLSGVLRRHLRSELWPTFSLFSYTHGRQSCQKSVSPVWSVRNVDFVVVALLIAYRVPGAFASELVFSQALPRQELGHRSPSWLPAASNFGKLASLATVTRRDDEYGQRRSSRRTGLLSLFS